VVFILLILALTSVSCADYFYICFAEEYIFEFPQIVWLPTPGYPDRCPLVVRLKDDASTPDFDEMIQLVEIDPSRVLIERCEEEHCYYMMRVEGLDSLPVIP
jgi:hypothetical protein